MEKIANADSNQKKNALKRRTEAEVLLLDSLSGDDLEVFNEYLDANVEYEDCLIEAI